VLSAIAGRGRPLEIVQPSVKAVTCDRKRLVIAFFDDAALLHDDDLVRPDYRRKPMRDHYHRAPAHCFIQRFLNGSFGFCVER
jgi:hypothetical protein